MIPSYSMDENGVLSSEEKMGVKYFQRPHAISLDDDIIQVMDTGNNLLHTFSYTISESAKIEQTVRESFTTETPVFEIPVIKEIQSSSDNPITVYAGEEYTVTLEITNYDVSIGEIDFSIIGGYGDVAINNQGDFIWIPSVEEVGKVTQNFDISSIGADTTDAIIYSIYFNVIERPVVDISSGQRTAYDHPITPISSSMILDEIPNYTITNDDTLSFIVNVVPSYNPVGDLSFSTIPYEFVGSHIDRTTGKFSWSPPEDMIGQITFQIGVVDLGK